MANYTLLVQRVKEYKDVKSPRSVKLEDSTISTMELKDENNKVLFKCFCCENIGPSTDTPKQDKRIVARTYKLQWTDSSKNGSLAKTHAKWKCSNGRNKALWVINPEDNKFASRRILIHVGNYPQDTEGCLLPGMVDNKNGTVGSSIVANNELFNIIEKIGVDKVDLVVKEIEEQ